MSGTDVWADVGKVDNWVARGLPREVAAEQVLWERARAGQRMLALGLSRSEVAKRLGGSGKLYSVFRRASQNSPAANYLSRPDIDSLERLASLPPGAGTRRALAGLAALGQAKG